MKRTSNLYESMIDYDYINNVYHDIHLKCKNKKAVLKFSLFKNINIIDIIIILFKQNYSFYPYRIFLIRDPKYRIIMSECLRDKLINHLVSFKLLNPVLEKKLIDTNVATRKNKGSSYAIKYLIKYINKLSYYKKEIYVLKIDVSKYFYNIDHEILKKMLRRNIKDEKALRIIFKILDTTNYNYINDRINELKLNEIERIKNMNITEKERNTKIKTINSIPFYIKNKGLPIGNYTSQILAIFYMNDVDHFIKEELKHKYYIRYMDDLIILDNDKERLLSSFKFIEKEINKLNLCVNKKSKIYNLKNGISFLGYTFIYINGCTIKYYKKTYFRIKRKLRKLEKINSEAYLKSVGSYKGYFENEIIS